MTEESEWAKCQGQYGPNFYKIADGYFPLQTDDNIYSVRARDTAGDPSVRIVRLGFGIYLPRVWAAVIAWNGRAFEIDDGDNTDYWTETTVTVGNDGAAIRPGDSLVLTLCRRTVIQTVIAQITQPPQPAQPTDAVTQLADPTEPRWVAIQDGHEPVEVAPHHYQLRIREVTSNLIRPPPGAISGSVVAKFGLGLSNTLQFTPQPYGCTKACPWKVAVKTGQRITVLGTSPDMYVKLVSFMFEFWVLIAPPYTPATGDTVDVVICKCDDMRGVLTELFPNCTVVGLMS